MSNRHKADFNENTAENKFYQEIVAWMHAAQYPQILIDDIMKDYPANRLEPFLNATPQTVARLLTNEYAMMNQLNYESPNEQISRIQQMMRQKAQFSR